jgi:hypothetical protein
MNTTGIVILLAIAVIGAYVSQQFRARKRTIKSFQRSIDQQSTPSSKPTGKVDRRTQAKLTRLLGGNQKTINRLLEQSRFKNPDRPEQWHWEKVLYDLERDRWR